MGGFWKDWAVQALLAMAVGHMLSGIIFFFAFNWNDLSEMAKFAAVGCGILTCLIAWVIAKLDSPAGQAFAIGATVLVGAMFAVLWTGIPNASDVTYTFCILGNF